MRTLTQQVRSRIIGTLKEGIPQKPKVIIKLTEAQKRIKTDKERRRERRDVNNK